MIAYKHTIPTLSHYLILVWYTFTLILLALYNVVTTTLKNCIYIFRLTNYLKIAMKIISLYTDVLCVAFSALTLLVGWQEGHLACKN